MTNISIINNAYSQLSNAYYNMHDRKAIEACCLNCSNLGIPNFVELANAEMAKIYASCGIITYSTSTTIEHLPSNVLNVYALACMNVLFRMNQESILQDCQSAYIILTKPVQFQSTDVIYTQNDKKLTVGDLLKVIKYGLALIDVFYPNNKVTSAANPTIWALQAIDDALNNKSKTELMNHSLHIAADFLSSNVKESLKDTNAKRGVSVSALMVNLAIDFFVKESE